MKKLLFVLLSLLFITTSSWAGGQMTLVTPDGQVFGTPDHPLVVTGGGGGTWYAKDNTSNLLTIYNYDRDTVLFQIDKNGVPAYQPSATSPAAVAGTGAGTGPILTIVGGDTGGIITLTTGTSCATSATIATFTFSAPVFDFAPGVMLTPMNSGAAALSGAAQVYSNSSTTTFTLKVGSTALADSTQYIWAYKLAAY